MPCFTSIWEKEECDACLVLLQKVDTVIESLANSHCWGGKQGSVPGPLTPAFCSAATPAWGLDSFCVPVLAMDGVLSF